MLVKTLSIQVMAIAMVMNGFFFLFGFLVAMLVVVGLRVETDVVVEGRPVEVLVVPLVVVEEGVVPLVVEEGVVPLVVEEGVVPLVVEEGVVPLVVEEGVVPLVVEEGVVPLVVGVEGVVLPVVVGVVGVVVLVVVVGGACPQFVALRDAIGVPPEHLIF